METTNEKKSVLKLDKQLKILHAMVEGSFKPEDANKFVEEYTKNVKSIQPQEYELHFDCKNLKVTTQDMVPTLAACFEMYKKDGFQKIIFDCGTSSTLKMQARRVAGMVNLPNYEII